MIFQKIPGFWGSGLTTKKAVPVADTAFTLIIQV